MEKQVVEFVAKRIVYETNLSVVDVVSRLNEELNKDQAGPEVFKSLGAAKTRSDVEQAVQKLTGGKDFMYVSVHFMPVHFVPPRFTVSPRLFQILPHHNWLNAYFDTTQTPETYVYVLGNPLIAQGMLRHDITAGLQIPPRILVVENKDRHGTKIIYDMPSSMMAVAAPGQVLNAEVKRAAEDLDNRLEALISKIATI